jgi:phosphatidylglycerol:prolipoprotein diacylglycerol transferase
MIVHNFSPVLVDWGFFQIRWYSIAYIIGIIIGWVYAVNIIKLTAKNNHNFTSIKKSDFDDLIIYLVLGIVVGGRLGYVIFYNLDYYMHNFFEIFKIWKGGMSFHGGLLGVIISIIVFSINTKNNFFKLADIVSCVAPIGIFFGRTANFINGELVGKISTFPIAVIFPSIDSIPRHPSQIYEAVLEGVILFVLINFLALKKNFILTPGRVSGFFLIFYSIARIIGEYFREPDLHLGYFFNYFSMGVMLSLITFLAGCFIIFVIKNNEKNN